MVEPLIDEETMHALAQVALTAMQTEVTIRRRVVTERGTTIVGDDYGDDDITYTETSESRSTVMKGSFSSTPTPVQVEDAGALVTVNTYKLALPHGSDVVVGDEVQVGSEVYIVSDTTGESTWQALLLCSLRKRDG